MFAFYLSGLIAILLVALYSTLRPRRTKSVRRHEKQPELFRAHEHAPTSKRSDMAPLDYEM